MFLELQMNKNIQDKSSEPKAWKKKNIGPFN